LCFFSDILFLWFSKYITGYAVSSPLIDTAGIDSEKEGANRSIYKPFSSGVCNYNAATTHLDPRGDVSAKWEDLIQQP
jgi:hypothetical protein